LWGENLQNGPISGRHEAIISLRSAWWVEDENVQKIFEVMETGGARTRFVGGVVRDNILHGQFGDFCTVGGDIDLATELLPEEIMERTKRAGMACYPTGIDHGTVTVKNGKIVCEVTTLRRDVKTDGRRAEVKFGNDWNEDARRRDFTINALYAGRKGDLFDPLASLGDLLARRVRFIGDADQRIREDRLRVFRFFRFTASHGEQIGDPKGLAACARFSADLDNLPAERVGSEMLKMLDLPKIAATLAEMTKAGVLDLEVSSLNILADYEDKTGVPTVCARLAILLEYRNIERMRADWRLSNSIVKEAQELREMAKLMLEGDIYNAAYRYGRLAYVALPIAAAMGAWDEEKYLQQKKVWEEINVPPFPINGNDLLQGGFERGPELGQALRRIESEWIKSGFALEREKLLQLLGKYLS